MSALKEEWASLMKLRESGYTDENKRQEIKSRIFNNFHALHSENTREVPEQSYISVKPDYLSMRSQFLTTVSSVERVKTPEIPKKFEFGLRTITPPPSQHLKNRIDLKSGDIWKIEDKGTNSKIQNVIPEKFEVTSIAEMNSSGSMNYHKQLIDVFTDMSPVTRYLANITLEEEEKYLNQSRKQENSMFSWFHLVQCEKKNIMLDCLEWDSIKTVCNGLVFKSEIFKKPLPRLLVDKTASILSETHGEAASKCLSEPPLLLDNSLIKPSNLKNSSTTSPLLQAVDDNSMLEHDLLEMMDLIKNEKEPLDTKKKLHKLLEHVQKKLANNKDIAANMHIRVLYQFLLEYVKTQDTAKVQENSKNPSRVTSKRTTQPKTTKQRPAVTPNKPKPSMKNESFLSSQRSSKWIGGGKNQAELEDDEWVSVSLEKKKKETRTDQLYKLALKKK